MDSSVCRTIKIAVFRGYPSDFELRTKDDDGNLVILLVNSFILEMTPIFNMMIRRHKKIAQEKSITIINYNSSVMEALMRLLHRPNITSPLPPNFDEISTQMIYAAVEYHLSDCLYYCIQRIMKTLTVENVLKKIVSAKFIANSTFEYSDRTILFDKCSEFILE